MILSFCESVYQSISRLANREATRIYHVYYCIANNHDSLHLRRNKYLVKHQIIIKINIMAKIVPIFFPYICKGSQRL